MENVFDLNIFKDVDLVPILNESYYELCDIISDYDRLVDNNIYFDEAVRDGSRSIEKTFNKIVSNTVSTTKDAAQAYDWATDAGGSILKAGWDLAMKLLRLAMKAIQLGVNLIMKIIEGSGKLVDKLSSMAFIVKTNLKGNITLYITYDDIKYIRENYIMETINTIVSAGTKMGKDDKLWKSIGKGKKRDKADLKTANACCAQIIKGRLKLKGMKFEPTAINLSDNSMRDLYFSSTSEGLSYMDELKDLIKVISNHKDNLKTLGECFNTKYEQAISSGEFATLPGNTQKLIQRGVIDLSKTSIDLANIIKFIHKDLNTLTTATINIAASNSKQGENNKTPSQNPESAKSNQTTKTTQGTKEDGQK